MKNFGNRWRGKRGLTLAEVLVAAAVLMIGVAAVVTAIVMANKTARAATNQIYAVHEGRRQLEDLRQYSVSDSKLSVGTHSITGGYSYVVSLVSGSYVNSKKIEMRIPWSNAVLRSVSTTSVTTIFVSAIH